jgi:thiol-disulfide isomerase/thioredoxin
VQAVRGDGVRLTFRADEFKYGALSGTSDVLGACRVQLNDAEQILIGAAIEQEAARLAYRQWKLQDAPEPKYVQDDGGGPGTPGRAPGTESAMVGKPAPDFELDLLTKGEKFRLSASKGNVVVLDFWATWCGPCLQAMPQVEKVAAEFRDQGVRLVAVNLQEAPDTINAMLQRHKLDLTVALDRDGLVAEKYGANAIPQTVVIDRDGNVARLFIGGGPHLGDQLRDALKALPAGGDTK